MSERGGCGNHGCFAIGYAEHREEWAEIPDHFAEVCIDSLRRIGWCAIRCSLQPLPMKIARSEYRWRVVAFGHVVHDCLEGLALQQGYRVEGVCQELGISKAYFREIFIRDVGLTPRDWMHWERMVVARRMLVWGLDPLEISEALGFSHPNSFRREFRAVYGVSPLRFLELGVAKD